MSIDKQVGTLSYEMQTGKLGNLYLCVDVKWIGSLYLYIGVIYIVDLYLYMYICIRRLDRETLSLTLFLSLYIYIYIYIFKCRVDRKSLSVHGCNKERATLSMKYR